MLFCVVFLRCVKNASFDQSGGELFTSNLMNAAAETGGEGAEEQVVIREMYVCNGNPRGTEGGLELVR